MTEPERMAVGEFDLDLGDGHWLLWSNTQDDPHYGAWVKHYSKTTPSMICGGYIRFGGPPGDRQWTLVSIDPPTFAPSLACSCGDHGFVQAGKWVRV